MHLLSLCFIPERMIPIVPIIIIENKELVYTPGQFEM